MNKIGKFQKYGYSDLEGYDIIDISNAMKLMAALRLFYSYHLDEEILKTLRKYASEDDSGLFQYFSHFFPDEIKMKLKNLDASEDSAQSEFFMLTCANFDDQMYKRFNNEETAGSFLEYCINVGRADPNYWGKIYKRIGILWETKNTEDKIYRYIKSGINFIPENEPTVPCPGLDSNQHTFRVFRTLS
ncbi:MAG: hypothetical protein ACJ75B_19245 [Flavisolibacter sp.]